MKWCGTTGYIAPELRKDSSLEPTSTKVDVYSAAVMLYHLLTGEGANSDRGQKVNLDHTKLKAIQKVTGGAELVGCMKSMLEKDPEKCILASQATPVFKQSFKNSVPRRGGLFREQVRRQAEQPAQPVVKVLSSCG